MQKTNQPERQFVQTADGSGTFFLPGLQEHYHSVHGALQESRHVFIDQGLVFASEKKNSLCILEVGFGTGLNCLLTVGYSQKRSMQVRYEALEPFPLTMEEVAMINHAEMIEDGSLGPILKKMHSAPSDTDRELVPGFVLRKMELTIQEARLDAGRYDLVYFDAFGPQVQPGCWTTNVFEHVAGWMKPGGILVTYSARGSVKRALKACGFTLEHPPGPPGKREMTRGIINDQLGIINQE